MPAQPLSTERKEDALRLAGVYEKWMLARRAKKQPYSQEFIAGALGFKSQSTISQYIRGKIPLNVEALLAFARLFEIAPEAISPSLTKEIADKASALGAPSKAPTQADDEIGIDVGKLLDQFRPNTEDAPRMEAPVPVISWVQAGNWTSMAGNFQREDAEEWMAVPRKHGPRAFALRVRGISMEPKYHNGSIIFVDPDIAAHHGSNVVVRLDNEEQAVFKQLIIEGDRRYLKPLNPNWPEQIVRINGNATICGVVIGQFIPD